MEKSVNLTGRYCHYLNCHVFGTCSVAYFSALNYMYMYICDFMHLPFHLTAAIIIYGMLSFEWFANFIRRVIAVMSVYCMEDGAARSTCNIFLLQDAFMATFI